LEKKPIGHQEADGNDVEQSPKQTNNKRAETERKYSGESDGCGNKKAILDRKTTGGNVRRTID